MKQKFILFLITGFLWPIYRAQAIKLYNPLPGIDSIPSFVNQLIKGILGVVGAAALFFLIYGGILLMTSGGNADKVKAGKETIKWAILGLVLIFVSYSVISAVIVALGSS